MIRFECKIFTLDLEGKKDEQVQGNEFWIKELKEVGAGLSLWTKNGLSFLYLLS